MFHLLLFSLLLSSPSNLSNIFPAPLNATLNSTLNVTLNTTLNSTTSLINNSGSSGATQISGNFTGNFQGNFTIIQANQNAQNSTNPFGFNYIASAIFGSPADVLNVLIQYKYSALFLLMLADSSGLPPPSEFIMPPAGFLSKLGYINFALAFWFIMVANIIGMSIDYSLAYESGQRFIYKHKSLLSQQKKYLIPISHGFERYGAEIIFIAKLIPLLRTAIGFIAGLLNVPPRDYYIPSILGAFVYNYILMVFGFFFISELSAALLIVLAIAFPIILYLSYNLFLKKL